MGTCEIETCGNKILSGYHKIANPCFISYPPLIKLFPPLTNSFPPLIKSFPPLTNSLLTRSYHLLSGSHHLVTRSHHLITFPPLIYSFPGTNNISSSTLPIPILEEFINSDRGLRPGQKWRLLCKKIKVYEERKCNL